VLRWQHGSDLRSIYLQDGRIIGAQLAGDIRAAGVYRTLMMRRSQVARFGQRLVEPGFGMADVISDALQVGVPLTVSG
jgi:NAD(P)H-nitrite reductase large subunit